MESNSVYNQLRSVKVSKNFDVRSFKNKLNSEQLSAIKTLGADDINSKLIFLAKVAKNTTEEEFTAMVNSNLKEIPAIKLTQKELELLKGGTEPEGGWTMGKLIGAFIGCLWEAAKDEYYAATYQKRAA